MVRARKETADVLGGHGKFNHDDVAGSGGPNAFGQRSRWKQTRSEPFRGGMCSLCSEAAIVFTKHEIVGSPSTMDLLSACTLRHGILRLSIIPVPAASGPNPFGAEGAEAAWGGARHLLADICRFADCVVLHVFRSHESKADQEAPAYVSSLGGLPA